ncbi:MAG: DUF1987 domain-containing protein [Cytophagia bacterium]|nr:MAG: DUF1987 domain-containing protein [Cytophagia bacterium]TAG43871.1 MAG: DUF1987 domain-containing protein [Cytophagia bacterium]TAH30140.1 MAG: DUF1987 domain-containing protein [Cytophagales bacterium]
MKSLLIHDEHEYKPRISLDAETGIINIEGESYHEYTLEFFEPIFKWLGDYTEVPNKKIELNFRMSYFNTSSSRRFLEIMNLLEEYEAEKNGRVVVNWYYEKNDLDMLESGEEYAEDVKLEFNLIAY